MNITQEAYKKTVIPDDGFLLTDGADVFKSLICPATLSDEAIKTKYREVKADDFALTGRPKRYSKRKIIEMLGDDWPKYRAQIQAAPNYAWDKWRDAQYLAEGDPDYEAFIATVPPEVVARLNECFYEDN